MLLVLQSLRYTIMNYINHLRPIYEIILNGLSLSLDLQFINMVIRERENCECKRNETSIIQKHRVCPFDKYIYIYSHAEANYRKLSRYEILILRAIYAYESTRCGIIAD